jgi:hypothetical protein
MNKKYEIVPVPKEEVAKIRTAAYDAMHRLMQLHADLESLAEYTNDPQIWQAYNACANAGMNALNMLHALEAIKNEKTYEFF